MRYARVLCVWCVYIICAWASLCDAQVISSFSAPEVEHVSYHFSPSVDETVTLLLRDGGSDTKIGEATHPSALSGIYRVPLSGSTLEFVLKTVKDTNTTENVVRTLIASSSISGTAIFDENPLAVPEGTHSGGFFADTDVTVALDGSGVTWSNSVNFGGAGTIDISGARFETFYSSAQELALTTCYFSKQVDVTAQSAWITDCLFNGRNDVPVENIFTIGETFDMVDCEAVDTVELWLGATTVSLSGNTFYGSDFLGTAFSIREASEGAVISVRNNTILGQIQYGGYPIDEAHNYYGAPPSSNFELLEAGWLNPWHLVEKGFVAADHGITEHCSLPDPRNVPAIRSITYAAGQEVMIQQTGTSGYEYYPESFSGYLRAGEPIAMSFRIEPYMNSLAGASYELKYGGATYSPKNSYTAEIGTDDIQSRFGNANSALNFIVPADAVGTNMWELWADFSGCPANIVASSLVSQKIANGGVVVREGFARPLRIGVLELQLDDGYAIPRCDPRSRAKAIKRIKDDLVMKLPLKDAEVDIVDLGPYQFTGGLLSSWFSQTDLGRANQVTTEMEWFVGYYNSSVQDPLDFIVGVAPVNALGGADGLSMALRRSAVLVDEFSPDAAFHEIGHSMGLYLRKEQYAGSYGYTPGGFMIPKKGLEIAAMAAFNSSGIASSVVPPGEIRHFPACLRSMVYDVMGAANPQWISSGTHSAMTTWLVNKLGVIGSAPLPAPAQSAFYTANSGSETKTVHVAALISRASDGDQMFTPSIRHEQVPAALSNPSAIYNLNFRFESYDASNTLLSQDTCKTHISDLATNVFWQQTFMVPSSAVRYVMRKTPSAGQNYFAEIWRYDSASTLSNDLHVAYDEAENQYEVTFGHSGRLREVESRLFFSTDAGLSWCPMPLPVYTNQIQVQPASLPDGTTQFKMISSDGIQSVTSAVAMVSAPPALPPDISIITPRNAQQALTGTVWQLGAEAYDPNGDLASVEWHSNLTGVLGYGSVVSNVVLGAGSHVISAIARDAGNLAATDTVSVIVGTLANVDLSVSAEDVQISSLDSGNAINAIGYGMTNRIDALFRNQGISNTVQVQMFLTPPGSSETNLLDETWQMAAFEERIASAEFFASSRGSYQVRVVCTAIQTTDTNAANDTVSVLYTNQAPRIDPNRLSIMAQDLPLVVPLAGIDPNADIITFSLVSGDGATISSNVLSFDNDGTAGSYPVRVKASDGDLDSTPATIVVDVYSDALPVFTSPSLFAATSGVPVLIVIEADYGPNTYRSSNLPGGLVLNEQTGVITGIVAFAGTYTFDVTAENSNGESSMEISLEVAPPPGPANDHFADAFWLFGPAVQTNGTTEGATSEMGEPMHAGSRSLWYRWMAPSNGVVAIGWKGVVFMPAGVGIYTGNTLASLVEQGVASDFRFSADAEGVLACFYATAGQEYRIAFAADGESTFSLELAYHPEPIIKPPFTIVATQGVPVSVTFETWNTATTFSAENLPDGLVLDSATGIVSGTPNVYGSSLQATISASNAHGSSSQAITFQITSSVAPHITSPLYATATIGQAFSYAFVVENGSQCNLNASPLPLDLVFDPQTSMIEGTPSESGAFDVYLSAFNTNTFEQAYETMTILVRPTYESWQSSHGLTGGMNDDDDGDGASNYHEYLAGTDARDTNSVLMVDLQYQGGSFVLTWPAVNGIRYHVQSTDTLLGQSPHAVSNAVLATPPTNAVILQPDGSQTQFFWISVQQ